MFVRTYVQTTQLQLHSRPNPAKVFTSFHFPFFPKCPSSLFFLLLLLLLPLHVVAIAASSCFGLMLYVYVVYLSASSQVAARSQLHACKHWLINSPVHTHSHDIYEQLLQPQSRHALEICVDVNWTNREKHPLFVRSLSSYIVLLFLECGNMEEEAKISFSHGHKLKGRTGVRACRQLSGSCGRWDICVAVAASWSSYSA